MKSKGCPKKSMWRTPLVLNKQREPGYKDLRDYYIEKQMERHQRRTGMGVKNQPAIAK